MAPLRKPAKAKREKLHTLKGRARTAVRPKRGASRRKIKAAKSFSVPPASLFSYEEVLLKSMLDTDHEHKVTAYALLFNSMLSSLSSGMRELYYKSGISTGRALYKLYESRRRYRWYEDSVSDLVKFLERAGYEGITYHVFPDMVEIALQDGTGVLTGTNMHVFEAGIMSGFLTAAKRQLVHVNEIVCANNGSGFCRFVSSGSRVRGEAGMHVTERFSDYLRIHLPEMKKVEERVPEEYYLLSSLMFMHRAYSDEIKRIMLHLGSQIGGSINVTRSSAETLMRLFGFGRIEIKSINPLKASAVYDRLRAREEFVGMSISFLDGLLARKIGSSARIDITAEAKANRYIVKLTETKGPGRR